ncbi:hypothetical protein HQ587_07975 [bacterium]|nr:hypothetical protein [bacterium]
MINMIEQILSVVPSQEVVLAFMYKGHEFPLLVKRNNKGVYSFWLKGIVPISGEVGTLFSAENLITADSVRVAWRNFFEKDLWILDKEVESYLERKEL